MDTIGKEYYFCRARMEEKAEIEQVYSDNWRKLQLFDEKLFQYYYQDEKKLNFYIVRKTETHEICGGVGYIKCSEKEAWVSALFVKKGEKVTLMPQLLNLLIQKNEYMYMVDLMEYTKPIYEIFLRYPVQIMKHYYKLYDWEEYHIAAISKKILNVRWSTRYEVVPVKTKEQCRRYITEEHLRMQHPYKSIDYIIKRYFDFPYTQYQYNIWGVSIDQTRFSSFIIIREQQIGGRRVGRIVDIIGSVSELSGIAGFFEKIGAERSYEYMDCMCYGIPDIIMEEMGFVLNKGNENVIPNRLEPLVQENDRIFFAAPRIDNIRIFHADADMDRPNLLFE